MTFSKEELKALARVSRELAYECFEGSAPEFGTFLAFCGGEPHCVLGHAFYRAGLSEQRYMDPAITAPLPGAPEVAWANDSAMNDERHFAVVFPLMAFADELENAAESGP